MVLGRRPGGASGAQPAAWPRAASGVQSAGRQAAASAAQQVERPRTAQEYIQQHHVDVYLQDVIQLLLQANSAPAPARRELARPLLARPQARDERPLEFIADYFNSVLAGTHVLLREFRYINACPCAPEPPCSVSAASGAVLWARLLVAPPAAAAARFSTMCC